MLKLIAQNPPSRFIRPYLLSLNCSRSSTSSSPSSTATGRGRLQEPAAFTRQHTRQDGARNDRERITTFGWLMLSVPLATFGLGCWQVQRKQWKEGLVEQMEVQTNKPPVPFPIEYVILNCIALNDIHLIFTYLFRNIDALNDMEYQSVAVKGQFLHDRELIMGPRSLIEKNANEAKGGLITRQDSSIGYLVITPFLVADTE